MLLVCCVATWTAFHNREADQDSKTVDEHTNALIDAKPNPALQRIETKLDTINDKLTAMGTRVEKLDSAVQVISSKQDDQTQKVVHDILSTICDTTNPDRASQLLTVDDSLVTTLKNDMRPATPGFFQVEINSLNQIDKTHAHLPEAFATRLALAEYRSSQESVPDNRAALIFKNYSQRTWSEEDDIARRRVRPTGCSG